MIKNLPLSYVKLSKENLLHNIGQFKKLVNKNTKIACVVKANAYGHGDIEIVKILNSKVDYFQVNSIEELARVRTVTKKPVFLFGYVGKNDIKKAIDLGCIISIFDLHHALLVNNVARKNNLKQKVHIAIDSYLGREGILAQDIDIFLKEIVKMKNIVVDGVYSHFANIEDTTDFSHAQKQIDAYEQAILIFEKYGIKNIKTHISATSGVLAWEKDHNKNNIVRIGIGTYGMWPSEDLKNKLKHNIELRPVLEWVSHIAQVKYLPKGHSVGYGLTFITKKPTKIAVIPQGYSDGLTRSLSNKWHVLVGGQKAQILGRVAMNMMVVDVSHIEESLAEDEVVILGKQGDLAINAEDMAKAMDTINYEVTTHINPLLPRVIVK